ncbi:conserved hypothetical protein [Alphaproteobacteria bacterium]
MATLVLGAIGAAIGGNIAGGIIGAAVGRLTGSIAGSFIDQHLFGSGVEERFTEGPRLQDLVVQSASYGHVIPLVYGTFRIAGNIIWASEIKEHAATEHSTRGSKYRKVGQNHTSYTYTVSLAIAVCEGPIASIERIWANAVLLDRNSHEIRTYKGDEEQQPDPIVEAVHKIGKTPAYRGIACVVLQDFDITAFGNTVPHFTFEVRRGSLDVDSVENLIESVVVIPGSGEFVYDTIVQRKVVGDFVEHKKSKKFLQRGYAASINQHHTAGSANSIVSLDHLQDTLPNVNWVSVVVNWFADSLNAGECKIMPGVEFHDDAVSTAPSIWSVAGLERNEAHLISRINDRPNYGGTISDDSFVRYLRELKKRNYNIMIYPMLLVDLPGKPWRGRLTGNRDAVTKFFNGREGYKKFILHYANLTKDFADGFIVGSELIGLTKVKDDDNTFPAVEELIKLTKEVRFISSSNVKLSYAADWSEYHHTEGGWYNLDKLWAAPEIDFVGVDAYFPLTDWARSQYNLEEVIKGWDLGEGYEFLYVDSERKSKVPLSKEYAWKNIEWWWNNHHVNPNGERTQWVPGLKKIWFTEYGFPSADLATNQPNVFYDPHSKESAFPYYSKGEVDILAQRIGIEATEKRWRHSEIVEKCFLWTWDARPYPTWPMREDVWADGVCWQKGHWVQGKLGCTTLAQLILNLCAKSGLGISDVDVSKLTDIVQGFVIKHQNSVRNIIESLQQIYFFDIVEADYILKFIPRYPKIINEIINGDLIPIAVSNKYKTIEGNYLSLVDIVVLQEADIPSKVVVNFLDSSADYIVCNQSAVREFTNSREALTVNLPIVLDTMYASRVAFCLLYNAWMEKIRYSLVLPVKYAYLVPTDIITFEVDNIVHTVRITSVEIGKNRLIRISGVAEDVAIYSKDNSSNLERTHMLKDRVLADVDMVDVAATCFKVLDIPLLPYELDDAEDPSVVNEASSRLLIAACGNGKQWDGCRVLYRLVQAKCWDHEGEDQKIAKENECNPNNEFTLLAVVKNKATIGSVVGVLEGTSPYIFDNKSSVIVNLIEGELSNISEDVLFSGYQNLALIGDEIVKFQMAELINKNQYRLSVFIRGLCVTENAIKSHVAGEHFILLDRHNLQYVNMPYRYQGMQMRVEAVTEHVNANVENEAISYDSFVYLGKAMKPMSPTRIRIEKDNQNNYVLSWQPRVGTNALFWEESLEDYVKKRNIVFCVNITCDGESIAQEVVKGECHLIIVRDLSHYISQKLPLVVTVVQRDLHYAIQSDPASVILSL